MGMFDMVNYAMQCPNCRQYIYDFQTKSMHNDLIEYKVEELNSNAEFYAECKYCGTHVTIVKGKK